MTENGFLELGFAKLDTDRKRRTGFSEVVFCQGKSDEYIADIFETLYTQNGEVLGTRATENQFKIIKEKIPDAEYDSLSHLIKIQSEEKKKQNKIGKIAVVTAGTADAFVAEEAALCAEFWGADVVRIYDAGVSGLHRLFFKTEELNSANVIIAVAGMEGALASVLGGLVSVPVIAVPTSVGYGANLGGVSTLLSMINSCANGISVVNIDNGFGAAYIATQINRLAENGKCKTEEK